MYVIKQKLTESFLCYQSEIRNLSPCTIDLYKSIFRACKVNNSWCHRLTQDKAREMIWQWSEQDLSASTINKYISLMRCFFNYLVRIDAIKLNPWSKIPRLKQHTRLPRFLSVSDIGKIYTYKWNDTIKDRQDSLCISLLLNYGLRVSEAASIKIKDINVFKKTITVAHGKGNKTRILPMLIDDEEVFITMANTMDDQEYLLPSRLHCPYQIRYVIGKRIEQICNRQKINPHALRHTFATMLINNGMSIAIIKELLGHASIASTQLYTHVCFSALKNSYNSAFGRSRTHARPSNENKPQP